jgi:hypothetical protein
MKRFFVILGVLLGGCVFSVCAASLPFPVGEELIYSITWNGIPVAWSKAVTQMDTYEGREVLALRLTTRTYPFFDHICKVDDLHESFIDPETLLPVRYMQDIKERNYRCHEVTTFDFNTLKAHYVHLVNGKEKTYDIKPGMRDIFSFMYFMRSVQLEENTETTHRVMADEKIYDLFLKTFGIRQVDLPHYDRDVPSLELKPEAMFDGLFVRKGKATVWISRDPRRLLTQTRLSTPFGRVSVTLHEVNGPGEDFWIKEKKDGDETNK